MKTVVKVAGMFCSGKTWASKQFAKLNGFEHYETDRVYDPLLRPDRFVVYPEQRKKEDNDKAKEGYKKLLEGCGDKVVIDGVHMSFQEDREMVDEILGEHREIFIYIMPRFDVWQTYFDRRVLELGHDDKHKTWAFYSKVAGKFVPPKKCFYMNDPRELIVPVGVYQQNPTAKKVKVLVAKEQGVKGGRFLDVGCAEGMLGDELIRAGAKEVIGLDTNWWFLAKDREPGNVPVLADIEKTTFPTYGKFDKVFCLSIIHRVKDIEDIVAQAAKVSDRAMFEFPINPGAGMMRVRYDDIEGHNKREQQAWCPTVEYVERTFKKYFANVIDEGLSPITYGDTSRRVMYNCAK